MNNQIAVYPGTFDPITLGHIDVVKRAAPLFTKLIIAVAGDSTTKNPLFSVEDRVDMAHHSIKRIKHQNIIVTSFSGLLVNFAKKNKATVIIRGIRAVSDFEHEFMLAYMNHKLNNKIHTILLPSTESGNFISSSFVKEIAKLGGSIKDFVTDYVANKLMITFNLNHGKNHNRK